ncbi:hypothetical protein GGR50DRAFT_435245 [Xylaria sp. CBS 124048]|nr:hypothetical protein GGR50DRAFT_435245 [Xylaria sp. CBS 124048]
MYSFFFWVPIIFLFFFSFFFWFFSGVKMPKLVYAKKKKGKKNFISDSIVNRPAVREPGPFLLQIMRPVCFFFLFFFFCSLL